MDIVNQDIYRRSNFDNRYVLLLTPNAYSDMLMRIFTPYLIFQCVFTDFNCVITLLHALSVALQIWLPWLICQKGGTLYSGARYVALLDSCYKLLEGWKKVVNTDKYNYSHVVDLRKKRESSV